MKIALLIERAESWRGGAETSTLQFAEQLAGRGCRVDLITTTIAPSTSRCRVVTVKAQTVSRSQRLQLFVRRAAAAVAAGDYDIVHAISPFPTASVYQPRGGTMPETLARNLAMRRRWTRRTLKRLAIELNLRYRIEGNIESRLLHRSPPPHVIAISQYVATQLREHYAFGGSHVHVIFNGVEPDDTSGEQRAADRAELRQRYGLRDDEVALVTVANNYKLKGVGRLIDALARLDASARSRVRVLVVGRGNPVPFSRQAQRLGVADRVVFAGPTQRVRAFFHTADALVHATYYDPCSRVVLEALTSGLPVVTTRYDGAAELLNDDENGFVIDDPDQIDALAERIRRLLDASVRDRLSRAATALLPRITMSRHVDEVVELYEQVRREQACHSHTS